MLWCVVDLLMQSWYHLVGQMFLGIEYDAVDKTVRDQFTNAILELFCRLKAQHPDRQSSAVCSGGPCDW